MSINLHAGDCRDVLASLPDASVDAVVTDPPYELGFMGKKWDGTGIAYDVAMWAEVPWAPPPAPTSPPIAAATHPRTGRSVAV